MISSNWYCDIVLYFCSDGLCLSLMSALSLSHHQQGRTGVGGGASSQSSSTSSTSASSAIVLYTGSLLSPLLSDLVTLISARKCAFEYYTVVILTDGQFTDCTTYMTVCTYIWIFRRYKIWSIYDAEIPPVRSCWKNCRYFRCLSFSSGLVLETWDYFYN